MPDEPLYTPQTLIQDIEAIILNGEEHDGQYWKGANLGNYNPDGELLEIIHDEIGMFEDIDEFLSRASFYKVDFDNDGYEDIVVHLREGNGRMAMYAWHYLCNDGKGGYRKTEVWSSCMYREGFSFRKRG